MAVICSLINIINSFRGTKQYALGGDNFVIIASCAVKIKSRRRRQVKREIENSRMSPGPSQRCKTSVVKIFLLNSVKFQFARWSRVLKLFKTRAGCEHVIKFSISVTPQTNCSIGAPRQIGYDCIGRLPPDSRPIFIVQMKCL